MATTVKSGFWQRVRVELNWPAFGLVALLAGLVSSQVLFQPLLFEMWSLSDIGLGWANFYAEILAIGVSMWLSVVMLEQWRLPPPGRWSRMALYTIAITLPALLMVWIFTWRYSGRWFPASPLAVLGETFKYAMLGGFVHAARGLRRHAERAHTVALQIESNRCELERETAEAQLQLLQAQIEPHFLFNTLANVRRLYRKYPATGAQTIDNLMTYLQAALPQVRRSEATLGEEFDLVGAYLQLFQVRMGRRLRFTLDLPPAMRDLPFPPMILVTLVENAIKHGLGPTDSGGCVHLCARRTDKPLQVSVTDDGAGFGAQSGGRGVGLANIRRQLAARFGDTASLVLEQRPSGGVTAQLNLPFPSSLSEPVPANIDRMSA